jgi:hypothetical protein
MPVYMGEMFEVGRSQRGTPQARYWWNKRLVVSQALLWETRNNTLKWSVEVGGAPLAALAKALNVNNAQLTFLPPAILSHTVYKSNSGNQGIFNHSVVGQLVGSPVLRQFWAASKYGCCCCIEERSWIAAMSYLGYLDVALQSHSILQMWGGRPLSARGCRGTMSNAVLSLVPH